MKNQRGLTIMEIVVAMGLLSFLAAGSMSLIKNLSLAKSAGDAALEKHSILMGINNIISTRRHCRASLGNPASPIELTPEEATPVELYYSDQDGNPRGESKYKAGMEIGKYKVNSLSAKLAETPPEDEGDFFSEVIIQITAEQRTGEGRSKHPFKKIFRLPATFTKDASGLTTMKDCYHFNDNIDEPVDAEDIEGKYYFGGMYASNEDNNAHNGYYGKNPITNNASCPTGFKRTPISMSVNEIGNNSVAEIFYACLRKKVSTAEEPQNYYAFGGIYFPSMGQDNPYTNANECPGGFTPGRVGPISNWRAFYICYKTLPQGEKPNSSNSKEFGGFYSIAFKVSGGGGMANPYSYRGFNIFNPETKTIGCADGFLPRKIEPPVGTSNSTFKFRWCYRPE